MSRSNISRWVKLGIIFAEEYQEVRQGAAEEILLYPHPNVRITHNADTPPQGEASYLHTDQLGSVRVVTDDLGALAKETTYRPFGEAVEFASSLTPAETKGFIGERFDAGAGLQYLNARYYDPKLGMFIQPDWFEVTKRGVGTNRYAYSGNDPINRMDPSGNGYIKRLAKKLFGGSSRASRKAGEESLQRGMDKLRNEAIDAAWRQEVQLAKIGRETRPWNKAELAELLKHGKVTGYAGHHINNVASRPELAGLADNIRFMKTCDHCALHMENGGFAKPISGQFIDRRKIFNDVTGRTMAESANETFTYAEVVNNAKSAAISVADSILNSRTMSVIDAVDPSTWALDEFKREMGYDFFDGPPMCPPPCT